MWSCLIDFALRSADGETRKHVFPRANSEGEGKDLWNFPNFTGGKTGFRGLGVCEQAKLASEKD